MPAFSSFTAFGFFEFSSEPSEHEKIYNALVLSYRDPRTGRPTIDTTVGTHKEAQLYGWAGSLAAARVHLRRAGNELRPETSYCSLEAFEAKYQISPGPNDSTAMRRAALAAKQKAARGPRFEAVWEALYAILGDALIDYRPIAITEAEAYPTTLADSPGIFRRADAVAKSVRTLTAATPRVAAADFYSESNQSTAFTLQDNVGSDESSAAQSFYGNGQTLHSCVFYLKKTGAPTGNAVAKIYAHTATFGSTSIPTGAALATSDPLDVTTLTGSYALTHFDFPEAQQIDLADGTAYTVAVEYSAGSVGNSIQVGADGSVPTHEGSASSFYTGVWFAFGSRDLCFYVNTRVPMTVSYENWNRNLAEQLVIPGDVLCVDPGNLGLVERVTVTAAAGEGDTRTLTAVFRKPHSVGVYATDGPVPLWSNSKRHVLVVVTAAAAVDTDLVRRVHELFRRIMRAPTTWAIVQPTTPGAGTVGPFTIGSTAGSPLGAVPVESITL